MKKSLLLILVAILLPMTASAYDAVVDGIYYNLDKAAKTAEVTSGDNLYVGSISIPQTISFEGVRYQVTSIGDEAFKVCEQLSKIVLSEGITTIGEYAFDGCKSLSSITIPETVTTIKKCAFGFCAFTSIKLPNNLSTIESWVFNCCKNLTSIDLPKSITSIREGAFGYTGLTSIIIPENVKGLSREAFLGCGHLTSITLPDGLSGIGEDCFNGCDKLTSITLPLSLSAIAKNAFQNCSSLTTVTFNSKIIDSEWFSHNVYFIDTIIIGEDVEEIEANSFKYFMYLASITINPNNKKYDSRNNCNAIIETESNKLIAGCKNTVVPDGIISIGDFAFNQCIGLTTLNLPNSVTSIGEYAFYRCTGLTTLNLSQGLTSIGQYAFYNCIPLTSLTIPEGVTRIETCAFEGCTNLSSIAFPDDIMYATQSAFRNCAWYDHQPDGPVYIGKSVLCKGNLEEGTEIVIKEGTKRILDNAFLNQTGLKSIQLPESLISIGGEAFYKSGLESITIPQNVTYIGGSAFSYCNKLTSAVLPENLTEMKNYVFESCSSLTSVILPKVITTIPEGTFSSCTNLVSFVFPENVSCIKGNAFYKCTSLESIEIPNIVSEIGPSAFSGCSSLKHFNFPEKLTYIDNSVFYDCDSLTSVIIPKTITSIGEYAFCRCDSLRSVTFLGELTELRSGAFSNCLSIREVTSLGLEPCYVYSTTSPIFSTEVYENANLYVPVQSIEAYKYTRPWSFFKKIGGLLDSTLKLVCIAGDKDVTTDVSVKWMNDEGVVIGEESTLECYKSQQLLYSVFLNESMGHQYHEIVNEKVIVNGDSTIICQLQRIENVELAGRVSAEDIAEKTATIHVKQMLNGKYEETFTTSTNDKGEFSLEGYDDDTEIIISCDGYLDAVIHRTSFNGNGDLGVITLKSITGFVAPVIMNYTPVDSEDNKAISDLLPGGLYDLTFTLRNESTGNEITDFSVQYNGTLIINSGASAWDQISITAKSKKSILAEATTEYYAVEDGSISIELNFIELGGISATYASSGNSGNVGYLYDSNGHLVARGIYNGETLRLRHIEQGTYTLVSIGQSALLSNIPELSSLSDLNMAEGKDYLISQVEVEYGRTTTISTGSIPKLNESLFLFDGSLLADKASVVIGNYVTLSARVNIDEELYNKVNSVNLIIDIPEGCQLVENSVMANRKELVYTLNDNTLSIHLTKEQAQGEIEYCIIPIEANSYRSTAYVSFDKEITTPRPLGVAQFEGEALLLRAPATTANKSINVTGLAVPNSEVKIYDGDVQIGKTTAKGDGSWSAQCELYNAYDLSFHDVIAKAKTQEGWTLTSEMKNVMYDKLYIVPSNVSMTFYNGWHEENITVDFDLINGTTSKKHYDFYSETDFTFLAKFTRNDPELVDDVNFMVKASDGTIRILPALFDSKQQAWVATSKYDSYKLPQNVTVDYDYTREVSDEERMESMNDMAKQMAAIANHIYNFFEEKVRMEVIEESETSALLGLTIPETYNYYQYRIERMTYSEAETMMSNYQFAYLKTEEGGIGTYTETTGNSISVVFVDLGEKEAYRITLSDPNMYAKKNSKGKTRIKEFLSELGSEFVDGLEDILGLSEFVNANKDFKSMRKRLEKYEKKYANKRQSTLNSILAKCPDGTFRLSKNLRGTFSNEMQTKIWPEEDQLIEKYNKYLTEYKKKLGASVATFVGTLGLGKYLKSAKFVNSKLNKAFQTTLVKNTSLETSAETLGGLIGQVSGKVIDGIDKIFAYKDFEGVRDKCLSWSSKKNTGIIRKYTDLNQRIKNAYNSCKKEKDPETITSTDGKQEIFNEKKDNNTILFTTPSVQPILDPSGYVYEAVLSNRLPGVTTTVYQKKNGSAVKWNAEDYSQQNPLVTDEAGFYRWDVPQGEWQVKYEKDGYETCYSEWLPVPPPQLDVNVGMKQTTPPAVKLMRGAESGITIEMSKYMLPESLNEKSVVVKMDGATRNGHLEMLNTEESPAGENTYVSKVKFVPEDPFVAGDEADVTVKGSVESYCSVQMGSDHTEKVRIEPEITAIIIDSVLTVPYQGTKTVQVLVMPQEVSAGKTLNARLSSSLITSLDNERIVVDENGLATLTLNGDLPGAAQLTLTMDKVDITAESMVRVDVEYEVVNTPTASIRNGEQVGKGTQLSLSCATEGATIYYTLDGSCPCNEDTRILYTGPFELPEGVVTVKVMAEAEYLYDSDVATFVYQVNSSTGINKPTTEGHRFTAAYANGYIVIDGAEGADCKIYDMAGRELAGKQGLGAHDAVQVQKADTYVISIKHADGKMAVKKIMRR